jgi:hypothetical protein
MHWGRIVCWAAAWAVLSAATPLVAGTLQENALRDGCQQRYATNKTKYRECISGRAKSSQDALIDGCYARYRLQRDKLRECLRH